MNVTWTPIGNGAMTFLVRIKDRMLLFDGARRRLASTLIPELEAICLRAEAAGGWNPDLRAQVQAETESDPGLFEEVCEWLDGDGSTPRQPLDPHLDPALLVVFPANGCNMACTYCLNDQGLMDGGAKHGKMSVETAHAVIAWLADWKTRTKQPGLRVWLVGGEPTLSEDACATLIEGCLALNDTEGPRIEVKLSSNGYKVSERILDAMAKYPKRAIAGISVDGPRQANDRYRVDHRGRGTYDRTMAYVERVRAAGIRNSVTSVVPYPFDYIQAYEHLKEAGFKETEVKHSSFTPYNRLEDEGTANAQYEHWLANYLAYIDHLLTQDDGGIHAEVRGLARSIFSGEGDALACDAGKLSLAIAPNGAIYPCDRFFAHDDLCLGNVKNEDTTVREDNYNHYFDLLREEGLLVDGDGPCRTCIAREVCRGGCYGNNLDQNGAMGAIIEGNCHRRRSKQSIDLYYLARLAEEKPEAFETIGGSKF